MEEKNLICINSPLGCMLTACYPLKCYVVHDRKQLSTDGF